MTDAPAQAAPNAADVTPDSYIAPVINLVTQLSPLWTQLATNSSDFKTILTNLNAAWLLPWIADAGIAVGIAVALRWLYTRALGRQHRWALWIKNLMPWNRA